MANKTTVAYKQINETKLFCDIYSPTEVDNGHVILWLHGGGLIAGSKSDLPRYQLEMYLDEGFTVAAIDYRLAPEAKLPEIIEDIEDAFEWLSEEFKHANGLCLVGHSAGGFLSLYLSTKYDSIKAVVSFYGYGTLLDTWSSTPSAHYLSQPSMSYEEAIGSIGSEVIGDAEGLCSRFKFYSYCRQSGEWAKTVVGEYLQDNPEQYLRYSPVFHIHNTMPPSLLVHAKNDWDVPFQQSQAFQLCSQSRGNECYLLELEEGGHMFDMPFGCEPSEDAISMVKEAAAFLKRNAISA